MREQVKNPQRLREKDKNKQESKPPSLNLKNMSLSEWVAFSRFLTFPLVLIFIFLENRTIAAWLYAIFFSTDLIDGILARALKQRSYRRAVLDSYGDVIYLLVGLVGFYVFEKEFFLNHLIYILIPGGLYLFLLIIGLVKYKRPTSYHTLLTKGATILQVVFLAGMLFIGPGETVFYPTVFFSTLDALEQIIITLVLPKWRKDVPSIFLLNKKLP